MNCPAWCAGDHDPSLLAGEGVTIHAVRLLGELGWLAQVESNDGVGPVDLQLDTPAGLVTVPLPDDPAAFLDALLLTVATARAVLGHYARQHA